MGILLVDDEKLVLQDGKRAVEKALARLGQTDTIYTAGTWRDALALAKKQPIEIAILDIKMPEKNGLELASELQEIIPKVNIIFATAYEEYALKAHRLRCSGYLLKPVDVGELVIELQNLRHPIKAEHKGLWVQCFDSFDVFYDGVPVHFKRSKTKEFFAYLISKKGSTATVADICVALFPNAFDDTKNKNTIRVLGYELKSLLSEHGCADAYIHERNAYAIDINKISCDYFELLKNPNESITGKLFSGYEWA